ncbi:MAG: zinc ribbon domain-containing protein [Labilithrix sp.]|nr:zinc ribbon domain-containing protein [Labilithrix sp.]MCW5813047.1 zinc ribbon domain-containing protein [Labilithrix sp.]
MTRSAPGARTAYPLSGLLICAACHSPMVISGGSRAEVDGKAVGPRTSYYRCGDSKKRGVCKNALSVREDLVRARIYGALREAVFTPAAVAHLRKRIAEHLGEAARLAQHEMKERLDRLARTEQRIRGLVTFIADGDHSSSVRDALRDLEAQALTERTAIQNIKDRMNAPVDLPTPTASSNARRTSTPCSPRTPSAPARLYAGCSKADESCSPPETTASTSRRQPSSRSSRSPK